MTDSSEQRSIDPKGCQHDRTSPRPTVKPQYLQAHPLTGKQVMYYWCPKCDGRFVDGFVRVDRAGEGK